MKPPEGMTISPRPRLWCLTHDCWDGDCGVMGQHEVEPRYTVRIDRPAGAREWLRVNDCKLAGCRICDAMRAVAYPEPHLSEHGHASWFARLRAHFFGRSKSVVSGSYARVSSQDTETQ